MAISLRASTDAIFTTQTSFSVTLPSEAVKGDTILVQVFCIGSSINFGLSNFPTINGVSDWGVLIEQSDGNLNTITFYGTVTGPENNVMTFSLAGGTPAHTYFIYTDWNTLATTITTTPTGNEGDSNSITMPNLTSVVAGNLMFYYAITSVQVTSDVNEGFSELRSYVALNGPSFECMYYIAPSSGSFPMPSCALQSAAPWYGGCFQLAS